MLDTVEAVSVETCTINVLSNPPEVCCHCSDDTCEAPDVALDVLYTEGGLIPLSRFAILKVFSITSSTLTKSNLLATFIMLVS